MEYQEKQLTLQEIYESVDFGTKAIIKNYKIIETEVYKKFDLKLIKELKSDIDKLILKYNVDKLEELEKQEVEMGLKV